MEFVDGVNLRQAMKLGRFTPAQALDIVPKICDALHFAHNEGILHRDIKPENILLDSRGRVKIADFGIAKILGADTSTETIPEAPQQQHLTGVVGTPNYMAPEQRERPSDVDQRADIYSLGVVFYEMLTGELPVGQFARPSQKSLVDPRVDDVVLRTLEKERERRQNTADEVKTQVTKITNEPAVRPVPRKLYADVDYKSKATLFGWPLVAVARGKDPLTGRVRIARGIIAIGGVAQGFVAIGGVAMGCFAFGGLALGIFGYGGMAIALLSSGGMGVGLLLAVGGLGIGPIALGGMAVGYLAYGGGAAGPHAYSAISHDALAERFFMPWAPHAIAVMQGVNLILCVIIVLIATFVPMLLAKRAPQPPSAAAPPPPVLPKPDRFWRRFAVVVLLLITIPIAIAIIGILAAIAIPSFVRAREHAQHSRQLQQQKSQPAALFSPVIDRNLGDSGYELVSTLAKPGYSALAKFLLIDEQHSEVKTISELNFYLGAPENSSNVSLITTWRIEPLTNHSGAWTIDVEGKQVEQRQHQQAALEPGTSLPADARITSWHAVKPQRSFWVGTGEWS
ncbi:MAG: serine/threonine-protein kinase, partial [Limisphaerales bacterium]